MPTKRVRKGEGAERPVSKRAANGNGGPAVEGMASAIVEPIALDKSLLDQEVAYYLAHLPEWHEHEGQHVLIHGHEHFGFFPTRDAALEEGFRRFGRTAFLVKQIRHDEEPRPLAWVIL
jgi:hypothetical protein